MIRDTLNINDILIGFENTLCIDYRANEKIERIVKSSHERLENSYRVKLDKGVYVAQVENQFVGDSLATLLLQLTENLKMLSLLTTVSMFDKEYGQTLKDVNYLGFAKDKLITALKYLQDRVLYEKRGTFFSSLVAHIDFLEFCPIKRLLCIMVVLEDLQISEGVAIVAQYLYIGGMR